MRLRKGSSATSRDLLKDWDRVKKQAHVEMAAARTAAYLSRVHDVPSEVLGSLNKLLSCDYSECGQAIYDVASYLRRLDRMERLGLPGIPETPQSKD